MASVMMGVGAVLLYRSSCTVIGLLSGHITRPQPSRLTLIVAIVSLLLKAVLYRYTIRWARLLKSSALRAKALDHRGDTMTLIAVLLGISGAIYLGEGWLFLEPLAAALVSFFILRMGWSVLRPAFNELTEERLSPEIEQEIEHIILATPQVQGIRQLRTRSLGQGYAIEIDLLVDGQMSVIEGHNITLVIEQELRTHYGAETHIAIHVEPAELPHQ